MLVTYESSRWHYWYNPIEYYTSRIISDCNVNIVSITRCITQAKFVNPVDVRCHKAPVIPSDYHYLHAKQVQIYLPVEVTHVKSRATNQRN